MKWAPRGSLAAGAGLLILWSLKDVLGLFWYLLYKVYRPELFLNTWPQDVELTILSWCEHAISLGRLVGGFGLLAVQAWARTLVTWLTALSISTEVLLATSFISRTLFTQGLNILFIGGIGELLVLNTLLLFFLNRKSVKLQFLRSD